MTKRTVVRSVATLFTAATLALVGATINSALADGLMEKAKGDGIRVAFYNFIPYSYEDDNGNLTGTDVDTLKAVLEEMGAKIDTAQATEWGNLIPGLKAGRFDVVAAGMFVTPKRCAAVVFSEPIFGIQQTLIVPKGNPHGIANYDDVKEKGLTIVTLSGSAHVGYAESSGIETAKIMQVPDNPTALAAMRGGRADVYALSVPGARELVSAIPEQDMELVEPFSEVAGKFAMPHGAFAFRPEDADFVEAFNKALAARIASGDHVETLVAHGMEADEMPLRTTSELCADS